MQNLENKVIQLFMDGVKMSNIAKQCGCLEKDAREIVKKHDLKRARPNVRQLLPEKKARFIEMCESDQYGYKDIVTELDISHDVCKETIKKMGIKYEKQAYARKIKDPNEIRDYVGDEKRIFEQALEYKAQGYSIYKTYGILNNGDVKGVIYVVQDAYKFKKKRKGSNDTTK
jgi:hypothetical protein